MREKITKYKPDWILIFFSVTVTEILGLFATFLFPSLMLIKFATIILLLGIFPFVIGSLKTMKNNEKELRQSKQKLRNIFDTLDVAIWSHDLKSIHF
ncbi:hypothetical protein [Neobacillus bataviensis]|uniref:hypothetical protein n=1 Tax=Neobacillus bataviensis TaxID=220685 RepID=UPI001CBF1570|nr:hypothetical protein [Neobacillus bataviensis]